MADNLFGTTTVPSSANASSGASGFANMMAGVNLFRKGFMFNDAYDEPTYLTFYLDFDFDALMTDPMTSLSASPLFDQGNVKTEVQTSAVKFLGAKYGGSSVDDLNSFNNTLKYITNDTPWYFQSISGVNKLWKNLTEGLKTGINGDIVLNIGCLEAIDLRIMQLAEFYQKAMMDNKWMRYKLPDNLRHFNMRIYIGEVRDIYSNLNAANAAGNTDLIALATRNVTGRPDPNAPDQSGSVTAMRFNSFFYIYFDCYQCEFDFSPIFEGQGGKFNAFTEKDPYNSSFNIKVGRFEVAGNFGPNNYTSNLFRDKYLDPGQRAELGKSITDSVISANQYQLSQENLTLETLAQSLGPISNTVQSALFRAERGLNSILATPNRIVNSAISEIQQAVENGKFGNIYGNAPLTEPPGPRGAKSLHNIYGL